MFRDYVDGDVQARALCRSLGRGRTTELARACVRAEAKARREVALPGGRRVSRRLRTACAVVAAAAGLTAAIVLVSGDGSAKPAVPACAGAGEVDIDCQKRRYVRLAECPERRPRCRISETT